MNFKYSYNFIYYDARVILPSGEFHRNCNFSNVLTLRILNDYCRQFQIISKYSSDFHVHNFIIEWRVHLYHIVILYQS